MLSSLLFSFLTLFLNLIHCLSLPSSFSPDNDQLARRGDPRDVWVLCNTRPATLTKFPDGSEGFFVHSAVWYAGVGADGPVKVEISINFAVEAPINGGLHLRIFNLPATENGKEPPLQGNREVFKVATTEMTNADLFDINKLEGFLTTEFFEDAQYRIGSAYASEINDCNTYVRRLLGAMNVESVPQRLSDLLLGAEKWQGVQGSSKVDISKIAYLADDNPKPTVINLLGEEGCTRKTKRSTCTPNFENQGEKDAGTFNDELALNDKYSGTPSDMTDLTTEDSLVKPPDGGMPTDVKAATTMARVGSDLKILTAIGKEALGALGVAGTLVGAAFVILDFINHNWVGGAIGTVGLAAGIAAGALVSGPVGWIVGGVIAALFAILPGLFQDTHPPAAKTDVQGILQWKMFGDSSHTGNEQCQKGTDDVPGNPDCTALYGSGTLSTVLDLNNFDSIAFLIQYNNGYPISIKDMAAAWFVVDPTVENSGSDKIATINCNNKKCVQAGRAGCIGGDPPLLCNNPTFAINRDLITLPNINAKASDVYNRVIPEPNGDCKLMAYPGTEEYDTYGVSITGLPSAIACGLSADSADGDGVSLPIGAGTTSNTTTPDNTTSTDGQGGAYVPAPPAAPFADLSPNDYACISSTTSHASLCLPPGTYNKQTGLGLKIKDIDTLTLPVGGFQFQAYWEDAPIPRSPRPQGHTINNYTENQSPPANSKDFYGFAADMKAIDTNRDGQAKFTISGPSTGPDPMCCLYSATALGGDAWCGGIGGGPILDQWQNQAQSAKCFNGGNMWIYADSYDDKGGAKIDGETDDLTNVPYGDTENFSKQVKAVWILKG